MTCPFYVGQRVYYNMQGQKTYCVIEWISPHTITYNKRQVYEIKGSWDGSYGWMPHDEVFADIIDYQADQTADEGDDLL